MGWGRDFNINEFPRVARVAYLFMLAELSRLVIFHGYSEHMQSITSQYNTWIMTRFKPYLLDCWFRRCLEPHVFIQDLRRFD